jgi:hypothetical protein
MQSRVQTQLSKPMLLAIVLLFSTPMPSKGLLGWATRSSSAIETTISIAATRLDSQLLCNADDSTCPVKPFHGANESSDAPLIASGQYFMNWITPILVSQVDAAVAKRINGALYPRILKAYRQLRAKQIASGSGKETSTGASGFNERFFQMQRDLWDDGMQFEPLEGSPMFSGALRPIIASRAAELLQRIGKRSISDQHPFRLFAWATVQDRCISHLPHVHNDALLSGVYYVSAPEGCGDLILEDPRGARPPFDNRLVHRPQAGELVIFPPWLVHHTGASCAGSAGEDYDGTNRVRVAVSFNLMGRWDETSDISLSQRF